MPGWDFSRSKLAKAASSPRRAARPSSALCASAYGRSDTYPITVLKHLRSRRQKFIEDDHLIKMFYNHNGRYTVKLMRVPSRCSSTVLASLAGDPQDGFRAWQTGIVSLTDIHPAALFGFFSRETVKMSHSTSEGNMWQTPSEAATASTSALSMRCFASALAPFKRVTM
jgi:hypothetical protein